MDLLEVLRMQLRGDLAVCSQLLLSVTKLISTPENTNSPNANNVKRQNIHIVRGVRHRRMLVTFIHTPKPQGYRRTSPLPLETESTITLNLLLYVSQDVRTSQNSSLINTVLSTHYPVTLTFVSICKFAVITVWDTPGPPSPQKSLPYLRLYVTRPPSCITCPQLGPDSD